LSYSRSPVMILSGGLLRVKSRGRNVPRMRDRTRDYQDRARETMV